MAAAALILAAGVVAAVIATSHRPPPATASKGHSAGRPTTPVRVAQRHVRCPVQHTAALAHAGSGQLGPAVIPAGYHEFRNPTGFSIAVPDGWRVSHQGHYVYLLPPSGAEFLLIDQSDHPRPDPLRDWQQQEASRESTYPGYHRIRLQAVHYAQAEKAADWEFTYYHRGRSDPRAHSQRAGQLPARLRAVLARGRESVGPGLAPLPGSGRGIPSCRSASLAVAPPIS